jgi:UDP-N-acetylglucosamine 2-epimerase (non-hydrolysing)
MTAPVRIDVILGTRPEAVKLLPVISAVRADGRFASRLIVTGQHRQMLDETLRPFGITPDVDLDIMRPGQSLNDIVSHAMPRLDQLFAADPPRIIVVQGDTTSAFCAALAAFHRRLPVAHLEAGLRSGDRFHPYPEEVNRRMISGCADLHFAPTEPAAANLRNEGAPPDSVLVTGNTAVDAILLALARGDAGGDHVARADVLLTLHRREAWAEPGTVGESLLDDILIGLRRVAERRPDVSFVYPVHLNPRVREPVGRRLGDLANVRLVEPLPYLPFVRLMSRARVIVTDSGGIQEEGPSLGIPVLILRKTTERPEALGPGRNQLVGTDPGAIAAALENALASPAVRRAAQRPFPNPYGDGRAAVRVIDGILAYFGLGPAPEPFSGSGIESSADWTAKEMEQGKDRERSCSAS